MSSFVLPGGWQDPEENPEIPNHSAPPPARGPNWGEVAGIAIGAAAGTVAVIGIAFFLFRWIRRKFFAPEAQPPPQIQMPPPAHLLPLPPLPHVLQWLMQHGGNGGGHGMEAPPPPAPQLPPPPPHWLGEHGGHAVEAPHPLPPPPPPAQWIIQHGGGHDVEDEPQPPPHVMQWLMQHGDDDMEAPPPPAPQLPPPPPIHWVMAHGEDGGEEADGGGEGSANSLNVNMGDFEEDAESVGSSSFVAGGPAVSA